MNSAAFTARLQVRRRSRSLAAIAVLIAAVGGIATALIAGSRRSSSVVHRYFAATVPYDLQTGAPTLARTDLLAIPGVVRADLDTFFASAVVQPDGTAGREINGTTYDRDAIDPTFRILAGEVPAAGDASAVMLDTTFAQKIGLHAGDFLTVRTFAERDRAAVYTNGAAVPHGRTYRFRVAAIIRTPLDIALDEEHPAGDTAYGNTNGLFVSDRFYEANRKDILGFGDNYDVELDTSTSASRFEAAVRRLTGTGDNAAYFGPARFAERMGSFDTPVGLETTALLALGIATAFAGAIVTAMLLRAEERAHEEEAATLRVLGTSRTQLGLTALLRTAPFAAIGAVAAVAIALTLSSRFPIGIGHMLEIDRGPTANVSVLAIAAVVMFTFTTALAFAFERRARSARQPAGSTRAGIARRLARSGASPEVVIGSHFAFDRGGADRPVPMRPAIVGGAVALALVVAVGVVIAGGNHLYASGDAHGWPWEAVIGNTNFTMTKAREAKLLADPRIAAATRARYGQADVGPLSTEVLAYDPRGSAPPAMLSGRLPRTADEMALGEKLLRGLHAHVGGRIRLSVAGGEFAPQSGARTVDRMLTVVGVAIPPVLGESEFGEVAVVPISAIAAAGGITDPQLVLARLRGDDPLATARGLARDYTPDVLVDNVPARIVNLHRVRSLPLDGALIATMLGTVLLAYTLAVAVRARISQLGVLRALGMTSRRVGRVLVWQGVSLAIAIAVIGFPLGLALGSFVWRLIADQLGVGPHPILSAFIALLVPAVLVVGIAASLLPAHRARRTRVASLLRAD